MNDTPTSAECLERDCIFQVRQNFDSAFNFARKTFLILFSFQSTARKATSTCMASTVELDVHRTKTNRVIRVLGNVFINGFRSMFVTFY